ncbi:L-fuconolactonase [Primorskyibacter sedentarius]|uniref:L-fuconolactonase n=1 Tax=Primorskyibacter sedentarius TaxID=745311 RepID=A0A4R3JPV4_9RHOB|nr:amidohydrolase family protein [Primorskyibacter sedentarius]TCS67662.1 L-fuconolactonase [Primorskyibacter sedentarius]
MIIDAHHHFWNPARGDYGWLPPDDPVLSRQYGPADLAASLAETGVAQTVLVQAAPSVAETEYLLGIADATPHVAKVVGWVDFEDSSQSGVLERLAAHPKFAGVRPLIQDIPDDDWMLRDDIQWAYRAIIELDLSLDCLGFPRHLENFHKVLTRYPDMRAVIDHCMKPQIGAQSQSDFEAWKTGMTRLARDTSAACKLSGLVTEAGADLSDDALAPCTDHVLEVFGADRVMWGSDWPVARLRCEYGEWYAQARRLTCNLDPSARAQVFGGTAAKFYRIRNT